MHIFRGLDTAYGQYKSEGKNENGKLNGKAYTIKEPPTEELFKKQLSKTKNIKLTRLGRGLSTGSELEYSDEETIRNAFANRK